MKLLMNLLLFICVGQAALAGNGVERGSVMIQTKSEVSSEITNFLAKKIDSCFVTQKQNLTFVVNELTLNRVRIDQGIIDIYYQFDGTIVNGNNVVLENVKVEILDSDFHNWRNYEEKLTIESTSNNIKNCQ